jgi:acetyltransferase-like isoleucine patch superfamily enzyme
MFNWLKRLRKIQYIKFESASSEAVFAPNVTLEFGKHSKIIIKDGARLRFGYHMPNSPAYPSRASSLLSLEENSTLIIEGDVVIGPGSSLRICKDAVATFGGGNLIGHDFFLFVKKLCYIGQKTCISWNVTLMDSDGHENDILNKDSKPLRRNNSPIMIGKGVGIQMNVVMPVGKKIGDYAIVAANAVIREDIPSMCLIYQKAETVAKVGVHCAPD